MKKKSAEIKRLQHLAVNLSLVALRLKNGSHAYPSECPSEWTDPLNTENCQFCRDIEHLRTLTREIYPQWNETTLTNDPLREQTQRAEEAAKRIKQSHRSTPRQTTQDHPRTPLDTLTFREWKLRGMHQTRGR